jgi:flavin reductase (DIM6/NTAB) family NADH-FMN oxidoreductase RutF
MQLNPAELSTRDLYSWMVRLITPRPIAWVSTLSADGVANLAPFSFFNGVGANPPTIMFCPANQRDGTAKDTLANIRRNGQFVVNLVTESVAESMNLTSAEVEPDVDEFEMAAVDQLDSTCVSPPRVAASAAAFECELLQAIGLGTGPGGANLVIGRILNVHVDDELLDEQGHFDAARLKTIGRMGGDQYVRTSDRFSLPRPIPQ